MTLIIDDLCTHKDIVGESLGMRLQMLYQLGHRGSSAGQAKSINYKGNGISFLINKVTLSQRLGVGWDNCMCNDNIHVLTLLHITLHVHCMYVHVQVQVQLYMYMYNCITISL